jgi:1-acyl-sn-glycerol-3-phosphate acyltransferase
MRFAARTALKLLTRTTITGKEHLPKHGPLILVGNHVAMIEAVLMVLHVPYLVEMLGVGDVPLDPTFAPIINTYGYIPINRGSMDRKGMNMALDVLKQNGVIGIFPEGGIWETNLKQARTGVAWLSSKAHAPIVPMGFGGMRGALGAMSKLKRPRLIMNIGPVISPVELNGKDRKDALAESAALVMERIEALIPPEEKATWVEIAEERFALDVAVRGIGNPVVDIPPNLQISEDQALAKFFHRPVLINTLARNLRLPVKPLQNVAEQHDSAAIARASQVVLDYLQQNPYFLSYRFGNEQAAEIETGIRQMRDLAQWAADSGYMLSLNPIRRYRHAGNTQEIIESGIPMEHGF